MINNILLVVFTLCIPVILFVSLFLYKKDNLEKVNKVIIIVALALELIRFFYNASFYEKAKTPSGELTFSFITFFIVFGLFASFNKGKLGIFFKRITSYTFLIPMFFAIFAPRVYLALAKDDAGNSLDIYAVENAIYFVESGLVACFGLINLYLNRTENIKYHMFSLLFSVSIYVAYTLISIGTKYLWEIEYDYDLNFYLSIFVSLASIFIPFVNSICLFKFDKKKVE